MVASAQGWLSVVKVPLASEKVALKVDNPQGPCEAFKIFAANKTCCIVFFTAGEKDKLRTCMTY